MLFFFLLICVITDVGLYCHLILQMLVFWLSCWVMLSLASVPKIFTLTFHIFTLFLGLRLKALQPKGKHNSLSTITFTRWPALAVHIFPLGKLYVKWVCHLTMYTLRQASGIWHRGDLLLWICISIKYCKGDLHTIVLHWLAWAQTYALYSTTKSYLIWNCKAVMSVHYSCDLV